MNTKSSEKEFAELVWNTFPSEWQAIVQRKPVPKKETVEYTVHFMIDEIRFRCDYEVVNEAKTTLAEDFKAIKAVIDEDIANGLGDEHRRLTSR